MNAKESQLLTLVRRHRPLVHHLTNWVTIYDCATIVKSFGASPVMAHAADEVEEMAGIAAALVLNIGTLTRELVDAMLLAAAVANRRSIPVVLDVCGAGATAFRDAMCQKLLEQAHIDIIKGNVSEVSRVAGLDVRTKGVDAIDQKDSESSRVEVAQRLARRHEATVVITGARDIVAGSTTVYGIDNGHPMMADVVGTGCMAASVIGTFAAVCDDRTFAARAALVCYEIAAEKAAAQAQGPGSFRERLFDHAHQLTEEDVDSHKRATVLAQT